MLLLKTEKISLHKNEELNCAIDELFVSSYVYDVFGAQRSRDCTVTVLVSQIKRGHLTAL